MDQCWPLVQQIVDFLGEKHWICGEKLMWIDFMLFELILFLDMISGQVVLPHYATLGAYVERFQ